MKRAAVVILVSVCACKRHDTARTEATAQPAVADSTTTLAVSPTPSETVVASASASSAPSSVIAAASGSVSFGMIGLLNGDGGVPWGREDSLGTDPLSARGNMWGDAVGDSFGAGGLGLSGDGGGGGRGEGIGLGNIGTLGHGAGTGTGQGFGSGHGQIGQRPGPRCGPRFPRRREVRPAAPGAPPALPAAGHGGGLRLVTGDRLSLPCGRVDAARRPPPAALDAVRLALLGLEGRRPASFRCCGLAGHTPPMRPG